MAHRFATFVLKVHKTHWKPRLASISIARGAMTIEDCLGGKLAYARELAERLENRPVPEEYNFGYRLHATLARLRHNATNYEELLEELEMLCVECIDRRRPVPCSLAEVMRTAD
jgi:hypothetical protein